MSNRSSSAVDKISSKKKSSVGHSESEQASIQHAGEVRMNSLEEEEEGDADEYEDTADNGKQEVSSSLDRDKKSSQDEDIDLNPKFKKSESAFRGHWTAKVEEIQDVTKNEKNAEEDSDPRSSGATKEDGIHKDNQQGDHDRENDEQQPKIKGDSSLGSIDKKQRDNGSDQQQINDSGNAGQDAKRKSNVPDRSDDEEKNYTQMWGKENVKAARSSRYFVEDDFHDLPELYSAVPRKSKISEMTVNVKAGDEKKSNSHLVASAEERDQKESELSVKPSNASGRRKSSTVNSEKLKEEQKVSGKPSLVDNFEKSKEERKENRKSSLNLSSAKSKEEHEENRKSSLNLSSAKSKEEHEETRKSSLNLSSAKSKEEQKDNRKSSLNLSSAKSKEEQKENRKSSLKELKEERKSSVNLDSKKSKEERKDSRKSLSNDGRPELLLGVDDDSKRRSKSDSDEQDELDNIKRMSLQEESDNLKQSSKEQKSNSRASFSAENERDNRRRSNESVKSRRSEKDVSSYPDKPVYKSEIHIDVVNSDSQNKRRDSSTDVPDNRSSSGRNKKSFSDAGINRNQSMDTTNLRKIVTNNPNKQFNKDNLRDVNVDNMSVKSFCYIIMESNNTSPNINTNRSDNNMDQRKPAEEQKESNRFSNKEDGDDVCSRNVDRTKSNFGMTKEPFEEEFGKRSVHYLQSEECITVCAKSNKRSSPNTPANPAPQPEEVYKNTKTAACRCSANDGEGLLKESNPSPQSLNSFLISKTYSSENVALLLNLRRCGNGEWLLDKTITQASDSSAECPDPCATCETNSCTGEYDSIMDILQKLEDHVQGVNQEIKEAREQMKNSAKQCPARCPKHPGRNVNEKGCCQEPQQCCNETSVLEKLFNMFDLMLGLDNDDACIESECNNNRVARTSTPTRPSTAPSGNNWLGAVAQRLSNLCPSIICGKPECKSNDCREIATSTSNAILSEVQRTGEFNAGTLTIKDMSTIEESGGDTKDDFNAETERDSAKERVSIEKDSDVTLIQKRDSQDKGSEGRNSQEFEIQQEPGLMLDPDIAELLPPENNRSLSLEGRSSSAKKASVSSNIPRLSKKSAIFEDDESRAALDEGTDLHTAQVQGTNIAVSPSQNEESPSQNENPQSTRSSKVSTTDNNPPNSVQERLSQADQSIGRKTTSIFGSEQDDQAPPLLEEANTTE